MLATMSMSPSFSLVSNLRAELLRFAPFAQMEAAQVDRFVEASVQAYYEPGEVVLSPASGAVTRLLFIRRGRVSGRSGLADTGGGFEYEAGDLKVMTAFASLTGPAIAQARASESDSRLAAR